MVIVKFERNESHPDGEAWSKIYGPFPWLQMTYDTLRAGENGDIEIAGRTLNGLWETEDGTWSDFIISAVSE